MNEESGPPKARNSLVAPALILAAALIICTLVLSLTPRYEVVIGQGAMAFKVNTTTGDTWGFGTGGWTPMPDQ